MNDGLLNSAGKQPVASDLLNRSPHIYHLGASSSWHVFLNAEAIIFFTWRYCRQLSTLSFHTAPHTLASQRWTPELRRPCFEEWHDITKTVWVINFIRPIKTLPAWSTNYNQTSTWLFSPGTLLLIVRWRPTNLILISWSNYGKSWPV